VKTYRIAIYPGDGIGREVIPEGVRCLRTLEGEFGFRLELTEFRWGHHYWRETGTVAPDGMLDQLRGFDAIYLGALGDPAHLPDHVTLEPLIRMRQGFDQYVCLRPAKLLPGVRCPLAGKNAGDIDLIVVRENSEGEYADAGGRIRRGTPEEMAVQTAIHTRHGVERILRNSFGLARQRSGRLAMATKSNAMKHSMVMWDDVFAEIAALHADVRAERLHVDAMAMNLVRCPERYDVIVASNLFGDILTDLSGAITGSLGLAPSANINPERRYPSLFEPVHGSAPDIAGRGIANPIGAIRAAAMMLDFLGESAAAARVEQAVADVLAEGRALTPDLGGRASTGELGEDVVKHIPSP
jgi:tartrate dehydrogenase/decarboxylase / D-malate dehydrogenase